MRSPKKAALPEKAKPRKRIVKKTKPAVPRKKVVKGTKPKASAMATHSFVVTVRAPKHNTAAQVRVNLRAMLATVPMTVAWYDPSKPIRVTLFKKD